MTRFDLSPLFRTTVGFDRLFQLFDEMAEAPTSPYPPYNIEKINENNFRISMAVAGFRPEELDVELKQNQLTIQGRIAPSSQENPQEKISQANEQQNPNNKSNFLHRGIAERAFSRQFSLAEHVRVEKAHLENGLLHIELLRDIPEEAKPKRIPVQTTNSSAILPTPKSANEPIAHAAKPKQAQSA